MKIFKTFSVVLLIVASLGNFSFAQQQQQEKIIKEHDKGSRKSDSDWLEFKPLKENPKDIFKKHKNEFELTNFDEMVLKSSVTDELGITHHRFNQYYKGLEVLGCQFVVHEKNGIAENANGLIGKNLNINVKPSISETQAEGNLFETFKNERIDSNSSNLEGILLILPLFDDSLSPVFKLVYKFVIEIINPSNSLTVYIDAQTGAVVKTSPNRHNCGWDGTVQTWFNGNQTFQTHYMDYTWPYSNQYLLRDDCRNLKTYIGDSPTEPEDLDNVWTSVSERDATTSHWSAEKSWDYFYTNMGWAAAGNYYMKVYTNVSNTVSNAYYNRDNGNLYIGTVGTANGKTSNTSMASIDIVGHEFTHHVTHKTAGLEYEKESGALNESFSDMFGAMIQYYVEGFNSNFYLLGEKSFAGGLRSLSNPNSLGQPSYFQQPSYYKSTIGCTPSNTNDYCGVHTNSGVPNKWFYLLSNGGTGFDGKTYSGIGVEYAAKIAYRTLTYYLHPKSNFRDAKFGSIYAALDYAGATNSHCESTQLVKNVAEAWNGVNVSVVGGISTLNVNKEGALSCVSLTTVNSSNFAVEHSTINCPLPGNYKIILSAGKSITMLPGFTYGAGVESCSISINPCLSTNMRIGNLESYAGKGNDPGRMLEDSELNEESFTAFPNPTAGIMSFNVNANSNEGEVKMVNMLGQKVFEALVTGNTTFDFSTFEKGIYILHFTSNGITTSKRIALIK